MNASHKEQNNPFSYHPQKWDRVKQSEGLLGFFSCVEFYLNFSQVHTFIPGIELSLHSEIKQETFSLKGQRIWNSNYAVGFLTLVYSLRVSCDLSLLKRKSPPFCIFQGCLVLVHDYVISEILLLNTMVKGLPLIFLSGSLLIFPWSV